MPLIATTTSDSTRTITLNRPERRNALTPPMLDELTSAIAAADSPTVRCVLLRGDGPMFCSGFDLALCEADPAGHTMRRLLAGLSEAVRRLRALPVPVVVAAHGGAIAGGCALLGGADVVVGDQNAKFGYPVVRLGVSPAVSAPTFVRLVGQGPARRFMLDPALMDGPEAQRVGLVHVLVDQAVEVDLRAVTLAASLAAKPGTAMAATRHWLDEVEDSLAGRTARDADAALAASLALAGSAEERRLLRAPAAKPGRATTPTPTPDL